MSFLLFKHIFQAGHLLTIMMMPSLGEFGYSGMMKLMFRFFKPLVKSSTDKFSKWMDHLYVLPHLYASNSNSERRNLWQLLVNLRSSISVTPWILVGDFNVIRSVHETSREIHYV